MPVEKIDLDLCTGCRICVDSCPMDVIYWGEEKGQPYIRYKKDCAACYSCELACSVKAVYVSPQRGRPVPHPW